MPVFKFSSRALPSPPVSSPSPRCAGRGVVWVPGSRVNRSLRPCLLAVVGNSNPKGIPASSPRLRRRSYLGLSFQQMVSTATRLRRRSFSMKRRPVTTPLGLMILLALTQGRRCARNLGLWDSIPLGLSFDGDGGVRRVFHFQLDVQVAELFRLDRRGRVGHQARAFRSFTGQSRIPTGFRPPAQGCDVGATLGYRPNSLPTPTGLRPIRLPSR